MHYDHIISCHSKSVGCEPPVFGIFLCGWKETLTLSFHLYPERHDDIDIFETRFHAVENLDSDLFDLSWYQGWGANQSYLCAKFCETINIRLCNPAMHDISHNGDIEALYVPFLLFYGKRIENP